MPVSAEADRGRSTELDRGIVVARAPLVRLGRSLYLFIVTLAPGNTVPLTAPSSRPGGPPQFALRWQASIEAEASGRWSNLEYSDGGGSTGYGPDGTEFIAQQRYTLATGIEPDRLRIRYRLEGFEPIEELLTWTL